MKIAYFTAAVVSTLLFISCNKTENVAVDQPYILDEEFINNDLGWQDVDTSGPQNKYFQKLVTEGNGIYSVAFFSVFGSPTYATTSVDIGLKHNKNYILSSNLTFTNEVSKLDKSSGIMWDISGNDDSNFFKVGTGYDPITKKGQLYIQRVKGGSISSLLEDEIEFEMPTPVANIRVEKTTNTETLNSISVWINGANLVEIDSLVFETPGKVGLNSAQGSEVNYHNIRVTQEL